MFLNCQSMMERVIRKGVNCTGWAVTCGAIPACADNGLVPAVVTDTQIKIASASALAVGDTLAIPVQITGSLTALPTLSVCTSSDAKVATVTAVKTGVGAPYCLAVALHSGFADVTAIATSGVQALTTLRVQ